MNDSIAFTVKANFDGGAQQEPAEVNLLEEIESIFARYGGRPEVSPDLERKARESGPLPKTYRVESKRMVRPMARRLRRWVSENPHVRSLVIDVVGPNKTVSFDFLEAANDRTLYRDFVGAARRLFE